MTFYFLFLILRFDITKIIDREEYQSCDGRYMIEKVKYIGILDYMINEFIEIITKDIQGEKHLKLADDFEKYKIKD